MDKNRIYTVKEVARLLGFSTNTVYKYLDEGKIKATRLGKEGRFRIPQKEVAKLLGVEGEKPQIASSLKPEESQNLEVERELYKEARNEISKSSEEIHLSPNLKSRPKVFGFMAVFILAFLLLTTLGIRNIQSSAVRSPQSQPPPPAPEVLSETEEVMPTEALPPELTPEATSEVVPNAILTVKLEDASSIVNIREEPSTDSAKLGKALYGDTFEFVSKDQGWYEIRLDNGLTGFISEKYIIEKGANN